MWGLTENKILYTLATLFGSKIAVNEMFEIQPEAIQVFSHKLGKPIDISIPSSHVGETPIGCHLLSARKRQGMVGKSFSFVNRISNLSPQIGAEGSTEKLSKSLLFHVHGGGWAAQTSKSHEVYLRSWAEKLDIPILSINYTHSIIAPFPRAVEEVFFAYCWALNNPESLGWTGENIILVGDSAGGNLNTACVIQCIENGIRKPNGLFTIYAPFRIGSHITPSRFLTLIDCVLPNSLTTILAETYARKPKIRNATEKIPTHRNDIGTEFIESYLLSPHTAPDKILRSFPPTRILSTDLDACLDDGVEFAKKLRSLNVDVQLDVLTGLCHGFLYWLQVTFKIQSTRDILLISCPIK